MKSLYKKYLYNLIINPYFYLFSAIFVIFCALKFFIGQQFFSIYGSTDLHYFFSAIPLGSILYVPLIASFVQDNKDENFLPFSDAEILLAKILVSLSSSFIFLIISLIVPFSVNIFGKLDYAQIFCGYFGIILFFIFSFTFAFFVFSFVKSKAVGFVFSAILLAVFNTIHSLFLYVNLPIAFINFFKFISFAWHFDSFAKGILSSTDILFFIILSGFFFTFTIFVQEKNRGLKSKYFTQIKILSFVAVFLLLGISLNFKFNIDTSSSKKYSLSEYSEILLDELEQNLYIDFYVSSELKNLYPQVKDIDDYLENLASKSSKIIYEQHNASKDSVKRQLVQNQIPFEQLQTASKNSSSYVNVYSAITLNYLGKTRLIPFIMNVSSLEYDLDLKLLNLVRGVEHNVQILVGNGLSLDTDYSYVEAFFKSMGVNVLRLELPFAPRQDIPLVVLGTSNFSREDCSKFENFILDGGKAFVATQPYTIDLTNDWSVVESNNFFTRQIFTFGMYFKETLTADISNFRLSMFSNQNSDGTSTNSITENVNYSLWPVLQNQKNALNGMTVFWPCALDLDNEVAQIVDFKVEPYLLSSSQSWQISKIDGKFITNPFLTPNFPDSKDEFSTSILAACAYKASSNNPSLILVGDQYAFSTAMINYSSSDFVDTKNLEVLTDSYFKLNGDSKLVEVKNKTQFDYSLSKISSEDFAKKAFNVLLINILLPLAIYFVLLILEIFMRRKFNNEKI